MFEKKEQFPWKIPVLILTGIVVLSGGIYIGVKTRNIEQNHVNTTQKIQEPEKTKDAFGISENCEVWLHKKNEDGSDSGKSPVMLGTVDKALLDKSEDEIIAYFKNKYPDRKVENLTKFEIILSETMTVNDASKSNKFSLEIDDGFIGLYKYDKDGVRSLVEKTDIAIDSLPKTVQDEIKKGITVNTEDEAYARLENFGS
ncbi:hypothetical protein [Clostridium sp. CCUG 7971]|uniref:hypothetical protein n=1 Tax=Clostridium sp. CCUG 7971 TaxID=2811414 RepID=UPI001ABBBD2B|nr:hypothetical protein [Clostridium sp. CCUG 7971]MBO3443440.1 hypothetical protein [Clostridium sp. CCUG 7971]